MVIAGGGTGGHLFPGLAVARALQALDTGTDVAFVGTATGLEARVVPREGFALEVIRSAGLKGKSPRALLRGLGLLPLGFLDAWRILARRRPHLVIGVGGYSSGPVVLAAVLRRVPTLVLEQNAVPGLTNRWLARVVDAAAVTYEETLSWFGRRGFVSGNPVRAGFADLGEPERVRGTASGPHLLVFGGSQGARAINEAMMAAAPLLVRAKPTLTVTHQTGPRDLDRVRSAYRGAGLEGAVTAVAFIDDMPRAMASADLVVSRAGATTIAELTVAGRAALLIPLPTATDDHQRRNADALRRRGAADVLDERDLTGETLARRVLGLLDDPDRLRAMRTAARAAGRPDAAQVIARRALDLVALARRGVADRG